MTAIQAVKISFFVFFGLKLIAQLYLSLRNRNHILNNRDSVPQKFADKISLEDHQKAANYTVAKGKFGRLHLVYDSLWLLIWIPGGGLELLDQMVQSWGFSTLLTGIIFFLSYIFISTISGLPWDIYSTFVLEEKFGFNKTTKKTFVIDMFKQMALGLIIGVPIIGILLWIMQALGRQWWIFAWGFLTLFQLFMIWAYPKFIAPLFNKFYELTDETLKQKVEGLLSRCDFKSSGLFVMNASMRSSHGNAYFTGFGKNKRIVFFDTLINSLEPEEVEAVLAHELGHFKLKHILKGMLRSIGMSFIGFFVLGFLVESPFFYQGHNISSVSNHAALMLFMLVLPLYTFFITPLSSWFSRKYEFEADAFAAQKSQASKLVTALVKMYKDNASTLTPDPLFTAFYHSHPPALQRIEHLEKLSSN